MNPSPSLSKD
jgi:hypothetical protein